MSRTTTRQEPSKGGLAAVFVGITMCALLAFGLSGVPGAPEPMNEPESRSARAAALEGFQSATSALFEAERNGALLRGLEKPGSRIWKAFASDDAPASSRRAAAVYLGNNGGTSALETLVTLLGDEDPSVGRAAREAVVRVMRRNNNRWAWTRLGTILRRPEITEIARSRAVGCVAELGAAEGQEIVLEIVRESKDGTATAIGALARLTLRPDAEIQASEVSDQIRELLDSEDPSVRRETALVLGQLGDVKSVERLVDMLGDEHHGVRGNAHYALTKTTGLGLPASEDRWSAWLQQERLWWEANGDATIEDLKSGDQGRISASIRTISSHPLFREEARHAIEDLVFYDRAAVRRVACVALGRMVSRASAPMLLAALDDEHPGVSSAAHAALRRVTGRDLPADSAAWKDVVGK